MAVGKLRITKALPHNVTSFGTHLSENVLKVSDVLEELFLSFFHKRISGQAQKVTLELFNNWCIDAGVVTFEVTRDNSKTLIMPIIQNRIDNKLIDDVLLQKAIKELEVKLGFDRQLIENYIHKIITQTTEIYNQGMDIDSSFLKSYWEALPALYSRPVRTFCIQTAHVIIARIVLYRVGEDKKMFDERISGTGLKNYRAYTQHLTGLHKLVLLIEDIRKKMEYLLPSVYEHMEFDWYYIPEVYRGLPVNELNLIVSHESKLESVFSQLLDILDGFDLGNIDRDVWKDVYQYYLNEETRQRLGGFYTPDELTSLVLDLIGYKENTYALCTKTILDPSCGSGTFIVDAAVRLLSHLNNKMSCHSDVHNSVAAGWIRNKQILNILTEKIHGNDVHPFAQFLTTVNLFFLALSDFIELRKYEPQFVLDFNIGCFDSLQKHVKTPTLDAFYNSRLKTAQTRNVKETDLIAKKMDFVVGNPPWGGVLKGRLSPLFDEQKRKSYKSDNKYDSATGKYDIFVLFLERGIKWLKEEGKLGFVTQNVYPDKVYGEGIRRFISSHCSVRYFIDVGDVGRIFFPDAMNTPAITILETKENQNIVSCKVSTSAYQIKGDMHLKRKKVTKLILQSIDKIKKSHTSVKNNYLQCYPLPADIIQKGSGEPWTFHPLYFEKEKIKLKNPMSVVDILKINQGITVGGEDCLDIYLIDNQLKTTLNLEEEIVIGVIKGKEIDKWRHIWEENWIIYPYVKVDNKYIPAFTFDKKLSGYEIRDSLDFSSFTKENRWHEFDRRVATGLIKFPKVARRLLENYDKIASRTFEGESITKGKMWYELHREREPESMLARNKIITPRLTDMVKFAYESKSYIIQDSCFSMVPAYNDHWRELRNRLSQVIGKSADEKDCIYYVLGIINSDLGNLMLKLGRAKTPKGDYYVKYQVFHDLRIPLPKNSQHNKVIKLIQLVTELISGKQTKNIKQKQRLQNSIAFDLIGVNPRHKKTISEFCTNI